MSTHADIIINTDTERAHVAAATECPTDIKERVIALLEDCAVTVEDSEDDIQGMSTVYFTIPLGPTKYASADPI